ncbi:helix-turn-helix domain-containing protein [Oceanobacillus caeni]|uniref:helix-turn-helix domain-containing protein n=1 Tax=Oceanobacillus caeni TaxID=405946 RepID=UPI003645A4ED
MTLSLIEYIEEYLKNNIIDELIDNLYTTDEDDSTFFGHGLSSFEFDSIISEVKSGGKTRTIRQFLIEKMSDKGIIQQELADKAGLSKSYMSNILNGVSATKYKLIRIALVLELNLDETKELLEIGGSKPLTKTLKDKIIVSCINLGIFDLIKVEEALNRVENANETLY